VDLKKRPEIANMAKSNLFISIHVNSSAAKVTNASGSEIYMIGESKSEEAMEVAKRENSVIMYESDYKTKYDGFDPESEDSYIIFSFIASKFSQQSLGFAKVLQKDLKTIGKTLDRGVKQAGFWVLHQTNMPSVLIELGFINNPNDREYMLSESGQRSLASAIYNAFLTYKNNFLASQLQPEEIEEPETAALVTSSDYNNTDDSDFVQKEATPITKSASQFTSYEQSELPYGARYDNQTGTPPVSASENTYTDNSLQETDEYLFAPEPEEQPVATLPVYPYSQQPVQQTPVQQTPVQQIPVQQTPVQQTPAQQIPVQQTPVQIPRQQTVTTVQTMQPAPLPGSQYQPQQPPQQPPLPVYNAAQIEYRVQFLTSTDELPFNSPRLKGLQDIQYYTDNGVYKYTAGSTPVMEEAVKLKNSIKQKFADAFVVKFQNGKRIK
jgi:N-acetylmuramoyl-L-alanine amidase